MEIVDHGSGIQAVKPGSHFDTHTSLDVERGLQGLIQSGTRKLICDLSETQYVSSAALRVLFNASRALGHSGGQLVLCSASQYVLEILETAGFTRVFRIYDTAAAAVEALKA